MSNVFPMTKKRTKWALVYVGLKVRENDFVNNKELVLRTCDDYCREVGLCVSVTETEFVYVGGREPGVIIGLLNYPRFPASQRKITRWAIELADRCMGICRQCRVTVETPKRTYMLTDKKRIERGKPE